jgi:hypothetical protein
MKVKAGSFAANTSTGDQAITGVGFQPKGVIFFATRQTTTGFVAHMDRCIGFAQSSTARKVLANRVDDNEATTDCARYQNDRCLALIDAASPGATEALADFVSMDSDGFTINWSDAPGSAWTIHYVALGGADLSVAVGNMDTGVSTGNKSVTGLSFQPDVVLMLNMANDTMGSVQADANFGFSGFDGSGNQFAHSTRDYDNQADSTLAVEYVENAAVMGIGGAAGSPSTFYKAVYVSMNSDGFTINFTTAPASSTKMHWIAIGGTDSAVIRLETAPTTPGTQARTGVGFAPAGLLAYSPHSSTTYTLRTDGSGLHGLGAADENGGYAAVTGVSLDALATSDSAQGNSTTDAIYQLDDTAAAIDFEADIDTWGSDGVTWDFTATDAAFKYVVIYFGPAEGGGGDETVTHTAGIIRLVGGTHTAAYDGSVAATPGALALVGGTHTTGSAVDHSAPSLALVGGTHSVANDYQLAHTPGILALSGGDHTVTAGEPIVPHEAGVLALSGGTHTPDNGEENVLFERAKMGVGL